MNEKKQHGGQREGAGPPRKLEQPTRTTITLEKSHLEQLKARYGREWQDKVRSLIEAALNT
jgi:hypothetical protein